MATPTAGPSSLWKEAIQTSLADYLGLLFPKAKAGIAWEHAPEFVEPEVGTLAPEDAPGTPRADVLVRVRPRDEQAWRLIHLRVQGQEEPRFARHMSISHTPLWDRYAQQVFSAAILTDPHPTWRPHTFALEEGETSLCFTYPVAKLTDWHERTADLTASKNPFAVVLLAHLTS